MAITENENAFVDPTSVTIDLSQMFAETAGSSDPQYLVLTVLDRDEYTAGATDATGSLSGNGKTLNLSGVGGDGRGAGIVFTYQASTGEYYNSTYGYLNQLTYTSSGSLDDVTNLSLFGANSLRQASAYATNVVDLMQVDASGYLGSATVVTEPSFSGTVPVQATPDSIAAVAESFIGDAWNEDGCWVLASTVAAEAGASLPVQSTLIGLPGQANGEWIVAFNGPNGQSGNWQSLVKAGEIVVIGTSGGGGHITTCVSGSGATAMLVDNIVYESSGGQIQNPANDGSGNDITIVAPHPASQEFAGVSASTVVIYELDTPIVTDTVTADTLAFLASQSLGSLFAATDPANKAITEWQVYDTAASDSLVVGGSDDADHTAPSALTTSSLSLVSLLAGSTATTDDLEARAFNGIYWGDWQTLGVAVVATAPKPPTVETQTPNQTWTGGTAVSLTLPADTFEDPQNETLTYSAKLASGAALPAWLTFNTSTGGFSGTAPTTAQTLNIVVTATDTAGLSATDDFSATVIGAPTVTTRTANQTWTEGSAVSLALPANTFTDPQGQTLSYTATLSNGQALPAWLTFNTTTETFSGTAPATAQSLSIKVTATDTSALSTSETFTTSVQAAPSTPPTHLPPGRPGITVTDPTPNQTWTDGQAVALTLPANTFTDALGLPMRFAAYEVSGPNVTSWLHFNPATDELFGTVPANQSGTVHLEVIATDALRLSAADMFSVTFAGASTSATHAIVAISSGPAPYASVFEPTNPLIATGFHS